MSVVREVPALSLFSIPSVATIGFRAAAIKLQYVASSVERLFKSAQRRCERVERFATALSAAPDFAAAHFVFKGAEPNRA